jgi:polyhydroxybutyrate depolymerase
MSTTVTRERSGAFILALLLIALPALVALSMMITFRIANRHTGAIVSGGVEREYILHVPRSYDAKTPVPLIISMHGAGGWAAQQRDLSGWNRLADENGFIVVYPSGQGGRPRVWRVNRGPGLKHDVKFITDLIDTIAASYNIDRSRVYANGLSNGGGMSFVLSCSLSERIAAVGLVAAAQTLPWSWCTDKRPVPMIAFHGSADPVVPYRGGLTWVSPRHFPNVPIWVNNWARRNRCAPTPVDSSFAPDVTRREYNNCSNDATVVLYSVHGGGHTWPGGEPLPEWFLGTTCTSVDATREMWKFFNAHPLK